MTGQAAAVAVFCGARLGRDPAFAAAAASLGAALARAGHTLIYGGGRRGLMRVLADAALAGGGTVVGVIPHFLRAAELAHGGLSDLVVTDSMHARKQAIFARADAFVALPGGIGTLDETIEAITWRQLGLHAKPIFLVDVAGAACGFRAMLDAAADLGFADPPATLIDIVPGIDALMPRLAAVTPARRKPTGSDPKALKSSPCRR